MSDWEDEMEKEDKSTATDTKGKGLEVESEEIIKPVIEYTPPPKEKQNQLDYEKKYNETHKDLIKNNKEIESAVANIKDDELKVKKKLELQKLKATEDFLGKVEHTPLSMEKDFIDLAKTTAAQINEANKPSQFTFSFLKYSTDLLIPSLPSEKINDLMKSITAMFNKKLKDENSTTGKAKSKKPALNSGKLMDRIEKTGVYADYGIKKENVEEEDYDEEDFM